MVLYEGFEIFISSYLGSGQPIYQIKGLLIEGRRDYVTSIDRAKEYIDKYLGTYVAPVVSSVTTVMSQEDFDQLQSGFLAQLELAKLKESVSATTDRLENTLASLSGSYSGLLGVQTGIGDVRDKVAIIPDALATSLEGMKTTIQGEMSKFTDIIARIEAGSATLAEQKSLVESMTDKVKQIGIDIKGITDAYEKALAAKGLEGWLKKIPIILGIGFAAIVGIKVLDVMD